MTVLVVYESMFGDAREIAEAITAGVAESRQVQCLDVAEAPDEIPRDCTLLVVGSPNHAFGLPRPESRADAAKQADGPLVSQGRGVREWLDVVHPAADTRAVTFDTRMNHPKMLTKMDHASRTSAKRLKKAGFGLAADSQHFTVTDVQGPLADGEVERARQWGRTLAELA